MSESNGQAAPSRTMQGEIYIADKSVSICLLCAFSFIQTEIQADGTVKQTKLSTEKYRLHDDRLRKNKMCFGGFFIQY